MIRPLSPRVDRHKARWMARREWRVVPIPAAILHVEGVGRSLVIMRRVETRWSDRYGRRLWRVPPRRSALARAVAAAILIAVLVASMAQAPVIPASAGVEQPR